MATSEPSGSSQDLYCFTQTSNSVTYHDHITEKLKDFSQGVTCDPPTSLKGCFTSLQGCSVSECVVSGSYIALLLEDGRVCRIRYSEEHPPLPSNMAPSNASKEKSDDEGASTSSARSLGSRSASPRPDGEERPPTSALHSWGSLITGAVPPGSVGSGSGGPGSGASFNVGNFARRGRIWLRRRGMGRSLIAAARWPIVPASEVPDDLVDQAMAVLQGKSREAVIRELQRTSLDVNQAVNNLLSREDDDGDDEGEAGIIRLGFPPGEELMSLLSSGLTGVAEEELEEVLGRSRLEEGSGGPPGGRESRVSLYEFSDPIFQNEIRSLVSLGDGAAGGGGSSGSGVTLGPRGTLGSLASGNPPGSGGIGGGGGTGESSSKRSSNGRTPTGASKKKKESSSGPMLFGIEWWRGEKDGMRFKHIAELYSELLAVDTEGNLHSWPWSSPLPSTKGHPRVTDLQLENEKIKLLSAKILRASVVTESGKLATWLDSSVSSVSSQLEQKAQHFSELNGETISALHVSELLSAVVTESGKVYWWGVLPLNERKQAIIQNTERIRLYKYHSSSHTQQPLVEGSQVCLRTSPIFSVGAKAIHMKGTQIQCGVLQEDVMSPTLSEKCQFHVIPSPSSSSSSGTAAAMATMGPTVHCEPTNKAEEQEDMETEGQLSVTINVHVGSKRRHSDDSCQDGSSSRFAAVPKSEVWSLRDVIFTDHVTNVKVGSVVKLDGNYVAVHYPALSAGELSTANLDNCRLLRKDELVPAKEASPHQSPYFLQESPKKLRYPSFYNLLTLACDLRGIHALFTAHSQVDYVLFNLNTSEFSQNGPFGELNSQYLLKQGMPLRLVTVNSNLGVVLDQHGGMFPISKNAAGNLRDLQLLNLPPVQTVGVGVCSTKNNLVAVSFRRQLLIPLVLRGDYSAIGMLLEQLRGDPAKMASVLKERCSGGCNVFHVLATLSKPQEPQSSSSSSGSSSSSQREKRGVAARTTPRGGGGMLREIMKQAMALASGSSYPHPSMDWTSDEGEDGADFATMANTAADILHMLSSLEGCEEVLTQLLQQKNLEGYTPFMAAIAYKAYNVARMLFDVADQLSESQSDVSLLSMVYPSDCHPDDNPVFILCRSDTCSFTWTGEEHIHQDIFECRTCGLTGSLCCCTECAYTCHRGHDCSFKRASPTAYCDCWEMCKCKALAPGSDYERKSLLIKLLGQTTLGSKVNSSQEHLLGMLASMVARQAKEQAHWSGRQLTRSLSSKNHDDSRPVCDLPPPKFAQKALNLVLEDWACVKAALMGGDREGLGDQGFVCQSVEGGEFGTNLLSTRQSTTIPLDAFTYTILTKVQQKCLDSLLSVLVKEMGPERKNMEAVQVAERFVRSVVRVFTVCHTESVCVPSGSLVTSTSASARRKSVSYNQLIERASRVFTSLTPLAVRQLVPMARAIILPVVMGITKPVDPNCMADRRKTGEEIFRLPPASLLRVPVCEDEPVEGGGGASGGGGGGGVDHDAESEMGDGEEEMTSMGVPAHDASSTATTGSNLLYLSDQESSDGEDLESGPDDLSMEDSHQEDDGLLDPPITHRVALDSHWAMPSSRLGHTPHHHHHHGSSSRSISRPGSSAARDSRHDSLLSMGKSSTLLAQIFSLLIRQLAETLDNIYEVSNCPTPPYVLPALGTDPTDLYKFVWAELEEVWVWLFNSMDMLESQLRFGSSVSRKIPPKESSSGCSKRESNSESLESRKQFFAYILTLLRGQFCEMEGMLPAVDVTNMEHLAWTFDALFYLLQNIRSPQAELVPGQGAAKPTSDVGKDSKDFFRRSPSTLCLGLIPPSPFDPMCDAIPVAEKPQLMDGVQEKEILFGQHYSTLLQQWPYCPLPHPPLSNLFSNGSGPLSGIYMWPKQPKALVEQELDLELSGDDLCGWDSHRLAASVLVGRWSSCLKVFATAFMDTVGRQSGSVLSEEQVFEQREKEFRREMDHLRTASHKDILLEVERSPDKLLSCIFSKLNQFSDRHINTISQGNSQPLCVHKVKVSFDGEPGEGSGVLRSLLTAAAEAIVSEDPLPTVDFIGGKSSSMGKRSKDKDKDKEKAGQAKAGGKQSARQGPSSEVPLFYQPGKAGFYAPRVGNNTPERLNAYCNVGRLIGLSLLFSEVMPLPLCRHVFKYILIRTVRWHDLAFFDPAVYESLRKMILDSRKPDGPECLAALGLTFAVNLRPEEGGETVELIPNGASVAVTPGNVLDYVKKYAMLRMVKINGESLQQMRKGLHEVLPGSCFSGLSAEDFRLLLCGCPHIDVDVIRGITLFHDESRKEQDTLSRFKNWFWSVLERMTQRERQDLLYFWTSSPVLPASVDSYQPAPSVTIRPPDDQRLPTANTCISRLYIPLYSSKTILKTRLLTAIKTKTFGFV